MKWNLLSVKSLFIFTIILSITSLSTPIFAECGCSFNGLYGGISVGETQTFGKVETNISAHTFDSEGDELLRTLSIRDNVARKNPVLGLTLGYGGIITGNFYLGGELGGYISRQNIKINPQENVIFNVLPDELIADSLNTNLNIKKRWFEFAVDLTPGVLVAEHFLLLSRIGLSFNKIKFNSSTQFNYSDIIIATGSHSNQALLDLSTHKNHVGLRLGLGLSHYIWDNLILNANYIYTYYGNVNTSNVATIPVVPNAVRSRIAPNGFKADNHVKMQSHAVMLGLNYYFYHHDSEVVTRSRITSNCDYSGIYGGITTGLSHLNGKLETNSSFTDIISTAPFGTFNRNLSNNIKSYNNMADFGLNVGYSDLINDQFYLGGELGGIYHTNSDLKADVNSKADDLSDTTNNISIESHLRTRLKKYEFYADVMPGILFCDNFLAFGRLGLAINRIDYLAFTNVHFFNGIGFIDNNLAQKISKTRSGLRLGFGVGQYITQNIVLTASYIYTWYRKFNIAGSANTITTDGTFPNGFVFNNTSHVNKQSIMVGLNYYFW